MRLPWKSTKLEAPRSKAKNGPYAGSVDGVSEGNLKGWIWRVKDLSPVAVNLLVDGEVAGQLVASHFRRDLRRAGIGEGKHGFEWPIPEHYFDGNTHTFELETVKTSVRLPVVLSKQLLFGELNVEETSSLTGWFMDDGRPVVEIRIFVDSTLVGKALADNESGSDVGRKAKSFSFTLPRPFLDSREHELRAEIVYPSATRILGPILKVMTTEYPSQGQVDGLRRNVIEGIWPDDGTTEDAREVALLVDGVEEARARTDRLGSFFLNVALFSVLKWVNSMVEVITLPDRTKLPYQGRHLIADALSVEIESADDSSVSGVLRAGFALFGDCTLRAAVGDGNLGEIQIKNLSGESEVAFQLHLKLCDERPESIRFEVNDAPVSGAPFFQGVTPTAQGPIGRVRHPSSFVPIDDPAVAARLQELALGRVKREGDADAPPISGVWRFVAPDQVEGWAVDMVCPDEPLTVTLYLDGRPAQSCLACDLIRPTEAKVFFEVPLGFKFLLPACRKLECELEVRPKDGGSLAPHKSRIVRFDIGEGVSGSTAIGLIQTREAIDQYVEEERLIEAFLLARRYAWQGAASIDNRLAVLDYALRAEWHSHEQWLASWPAESSAIGLRNYLRSGPNLRNGETSGLMSPSFSIARFGLPESYGSLLRPDESDNSSENILAVAEKTLVWRALVAGEKELSLWPEPERVSILYFLESDDLHPLFLPYLTAAVKRGLAVTVLTGLGDKDSRISDLAAAGVTVAGTGGNDFEAIVGDLAGEREFLFAARDQQIFGVGALCLWPRLLAQREVFLTVAETSSSAALSLLGRGPAGRSRVFQEPSLQTLLRWLTADEKTEEKCRSASALEISAFRFRPPLSLEPALIVLHDFSSESELPRLPVEAVAFRLEKEPRILVQGKEHPLAALENLMKDMYSSGDDIAVTFLSRRLHYPNNYLQECLRLWRVHGGKIRLSLCPLDYQDDRKALSAVHDKLPFLSFYSLLPASCLFLRDVSQLVGNFIGLEDLVLLRDQPFLSSPLLAAEKRSQGSIEQILARMDRSPRAREKAFVGTALARRAGAAASLPNSVLRIMAPAIQEREAFVTRAKATLALPFTAVPALSELERLVSFGERSLAEQMVLKSIEKPDEIHAAKPAEIEALLKGATLLGLQAPVADCLRPMATSIISQAPELLSPLFDFLALTSSEGDYTAALFSCLPQLANWPEKNTIYRFAELCRKYCSAGAFLALLYWIDSSGDGEILHKNRFASLAGNALILGDGMRFRLPRSGLDQDYFIERAALEKRLLQAVDKGDRAAVVNLSNRLLAQPGDGPITLFRYLRTYSYELSALGIVLGEMGHALLLSAKEQLMLASMLNDKSHILRHLEDFLSTMQVPGEEALIVGSTCLGNYSLLERAYGGWARAADVAPITFSGDSIWSTFDNFTKAEVPPQAKRQSEKVSVIMTLYNPDLELLRSAIQSILRQTYGNFELLLIDDASDRVESERIAAFAGLDERINFHRMERNRGPYVGRNRALEMCSGSYVAIQDGDDYSHPQRLERQVAALRADPVLQLCTSSHLRIDRNAHVQFEHTLGILGDGTMSSMFRRSLFDRLGPFAAVRSRGDVEFRTRLKSSHGSHVIDHIECPLIFCYATPASLSNQVARDDSHFLSLFRGALEALLRDPALPGRSYDHHRLAPVPWPLSV